MRMHKKKAGNELVTNVRLFLTLFFLYVVYPQYLHVSAWYERLVTHRAPTHRGNHLMGQLRESIGYRAPRGMTNTFIIIIYCRINTPTRQLLTHSRHTRQQPQRNTLTRNVYKRHPLWPYLDRIRQIIEIALTRLPQPQSFFLYDYRQHAVAATN